MIVGLSVEIRFHRRSINAPRSSSNDDVGVAVRAPGGEAFGTKGEQPLDLAVGAVEMCSLAVAGHRRRDPPELELAELVHAVSREVRIDRAEGTVRELGIAPMDHDLVRAAASPEARNTGTDEGPCRCVFGLSESTSASS